MGFHTLGSCRRRPRVMVLMWMASVIFLCKNGRGHPHQDEQGDHELGQWPTAASCVESHPQFTLTATSTHRLLLLLSTSSFGA